MLGGMLRAARQVREKLAELHATGAGQCGNKSAWPDLRLLQRSLDA